MKKMTNTNHQPLSGYVLFMDVTDSLGRKWKLLVAPVRSGVRLYFKTLGEYCRWVDRVNEVRDMADGKLTVRERMMAAVWSGDVPETVALRAMERRYG